MPKAARAGWLLIFYSVPSHPVSSRMKIWRKLAKAGAVQLKGAVYILPATAEHHELFQWIIGEVRSLGGDGAFVRAERIEALPDDEVRELFNEQRSAEYRTLGKSLDDLERKIQSGRKGTVAGLRESAAAPLAALRKAYEETRARDFFGVPLGGKTGRRIDALSAALKDIRAPGAERPAPPVRKDPKAYRRRVWVTRRRPFVDRMASAWLIRRFVDPDAAFRFIDERERTGIAPREISFDMQNGDFTHLGELCTYEVLIRSFGIRDRTARKIAEIVHDLDLKDNKFSAGEAPGIESVLAGIRESVPDDREALERGMEVFEALYTAKR